MNVCAVACISCACVVSLAHADAITIVADRDNTIYSEDAETSNGAGDYFFTGRTDNSALRRGLVYFDVAGSIAAGSVITDVQLELYMSRTQAGGEPVSIHFVNADWGEGASAAPGQEGAGTSAEDDDATWEYRFYNSADPPTSPAWASLGGDFVATASATTTVSGSGTYAWGSTIDMVADAQAWLDGPSANFGWIVVGNESVDKTAKRFNSHTSSNASRHPQLIVTFTPPAASGACCFTDGTCSVLSMTDCTNAGGTYQGDGTSCTPNPCPQPDGACCFNDASCMELSETDCITMGGTWQGPSTLCINVECPLILEKYVDAMTQPPIATPTTGTVGGTATYDIDIVQVTQKLHRDLPDTTLWTYEGTFPGPTIVASEGDPVTVNWINDLRDEFNVPRTDHILAVDECPHGAENNAKVIVHLHGGHVPPDVDGYPEDAYTPGNSASYTYPNFNQDAALLWYHDHALGITRLNVMAGLAGAYIVRDANENSLGLPSGAYEVPIIIQDRKFNPDGSLNYPSTLEEVFFGDTMLVNGVVWPFFDVEQAKYRFRVLNGCNSRVLTLSFSNGQVMEIIGSEGGLLEQPVSRTVVTIAGGERLDMLVDFTGIPQGTEIFLTNSATAPFPSGVPENDLAEVMKFVVTSTSGPAPATPPNLNTIPALQEGDAQVTRNFILRKQPDGSPGCPPNEWLINDLHWDDITETPFEDDIEIWQFDNLSGVSHPMHMHLVFFQVLDRQALDGTGTPIGVPVPPDAVEAGWKDTVRVDPSERVRVIAHFEDYTGLYAYHCHILEHEDHEMMRQFQVIPRCDGDANGDGVVDVNDIAYVIFRLETCAADGTPCPNGCDGDANGDGQVDINDIAFVIFRLGNCDPLSFSCP